MMKKLLTVFFALTMMMSTIVFTPSIAASAVTDDKLSADINLQVGTLSGSVFTPLDSGTALKTNDVITIRICPKTDFYCGSTSYVAMFDKLYFSVVGSNKAAFTANADNAFYDQTASGFSGTTSLPDSVWPPTMGATENYSVYKAIRVGNQADSNSNNGGYPSLLPGTWLFQFKLKVLKDINKGDEARVLMDKRWFRSPTYTTGTAYFAKCATATQLSSSASSTTYNFDIDMSGANINLAPSTTTTTTAATTAPATTAVATTGTTAVATTTKPGATTTKPGATTTKPGATTTKPGATTTKHTVTTTKHGATTTKPAVTTTKHGATTTKPVSTTAKPTGTNTTVPNTSVNGTTGKGTTELNTTDSGNITTTLTTNKESTTKAADDAGNNTNARRTGIIVVLIAVLATLAGVIAYLIKKKK